LITGRCPHPVESREKPGYTFPMAKTPMCERISSRAWLRVGQRSLPPLYIVVCLVLLVPVWSGCGSSGAGTGDEVTFTSPDTWNIDAGGISPCNAQDMCPPEKPFCDLDTNQCVQCFDNANCSTGLICVQGVCACNPGSMHCQGNQAWVCQADGRGFDKEICAGDCQGGVCVACSPGQLTCSNGNVALCDANGNLGQVVDICTDGCVDGVCTTCFPSDARCVEDNVEICAADGSGYVFDRDCSDEPGGQVCIQGQCLDPCSGDFKFFSNVGCEYWGVDLDQADADSHGSPFAFVVSNVGKELPAHVTVLRAGVPIDEVDIGPEQLHIFELAPYNVDGSMQGTRSYQIKSDRPIIAYQFNPLENVMVYSNDASLLLPLNSLGTQYRVLGWPDLGSWHGYVTIVATRDNTEVSVKVTSMTLGGAGVPALAPGDVHTTTMQAFEVLNIETNGRGQDLSGTTITASERVAVFSGHEASYVPKESPCSGGVCSFNPTETCESDIDCIGPCCADHLEEQLIPEAAWGTTYIAARSKPRKFEGDVWRIIASEDGTTVNLSPSLAVVPMLNAGEVFDIDTDSSFVINADKPILVGQFLQGQNAPNPYYGGVCNSEGTAMLCTPSGRWCDGPPWCLPGEECVESVVTACNISGTPCLIDQHCSDVFESTDAGIGDPAFIMSVPVQQLRDDYIFLVPNKYLEDYLILYAKVGTSVSLDGQSLDNQGWTTIADGWQYLHLAVADGVHRLTGTNTFGAVVHGYDQYVSYGYPAGMNISTLVSPNP